MTGDPIQKTTQHIAQTNDKPLDQRLRRDIFSAVAKLKPSLRSHPDLENAIACGKLFEELPTSLQAVASLKLDLAIGFYHQFGWRPQWLSDPLSQWIDEPALGKIQERYQCTSMHDLAYVPFKHLEKLLGKEEAGALYQNIKQRLL